MNRTWLSLSLLVLLPACWVTTEQGQSMQADIAGLKTDVEDARKRAEDQTAQAKREHDAQIKKADQKIQEVNAALESLSRVEHKTGADLVSQLDDQDKEVARLRGLVEEYQAKNAALQQSTAQLQVDLSARIAELEKKLAEVEPLLKAEQEARQKESERRKLESQAPTGKEALYKFAKKKLDDGHPSAARDLFAEFIQKWKGDSLAASAQYWIGESYFQEKDYRKAGLEFQKVCDQHPKSEKAPDAELRVAESFMKLNMMKEAKVVLQTVVENYPKTSAAKQAARKLKDLKQKKE